MSNATDLANHIRTASDFVVEIFYAQVYTIEFLDSFDFTIQNKL